MSEADDTLLHRISGLVEEEHTLRSDPSSHGGGDQDRLRELEEQLDRCWDLLRQRRARREFDQDPDEASARSVDTVEHYQQ